MSVLFIYRCIYFFFRIFVFNFVICSSVYYEIISEIGRGKPRRSVPEPYICIGKRFIILQYNLLIACIVCSVPAHINRKMIVHYFNGFARSDGFVFTVFRKYKHTENKTQHCDKNRQRFQNQTLFSFHRFPLPR